MKGRVNSADNCPDLISAIRHGDKGVFEKLYKEHYKGLYTLAYRYVARHEVAEEIVHDVFIAVWNKADVIKIESSVKSYLVRSVINASLNYVKKEKSDARRQEDFPLEVVHGDEEEMYEKNEQLLVKLEEALSLLPPQCRKVMMMSRFEKLKQQEIANRLNISIKTVKNHLTYGFAKLRQAMAAGGILLVIIKIVMPPIIDAISK